jgi:hypothetical protein
MMYAGPCLIETNNPFRSLDWRWARASRLVECGKRASRRRDDAVTADAVRFLVGERRCQTASARSRHERRWAGLLAAQRLRAEGSLRWEVQARLLAGQTDAEIADACGLDAEVVYWFESLFFHVRDRLQARDWIAIRVLDVPLLKGLHVDDLEKIWMLFGYYGGAAMLPDVMAVSVQIKQTGDAFFSTAADSTTRDWAVLISLLTLPPGSTPSPVLKAELARLENSKAESPAYVSIGDSDLLSTRVADLLEGGRTAAAETKKNG